MSSRTKRFAHGLRFFAGYKDFHGALTSLPAGALSTRRFFSYTCGSLVPITLQRNLDNSSSVIARIASAFVGLDT